MKNILKPFIVTTIVSLVISMNTNVFADNFSIQMPSGFGLNSSSFGLKTKNVWGSGFDSSINLNLDQYLNSDGTFTLTQNIPSIPAVDRVITKNGVDYYIMKVYTGNQLAIALDPPSVFVEPWPDGYDRYIDYNGKRYAVYYSPIYGMGMGLDLDTGTINKNRSYILQYMNPFSNYLEYINVDDFILNTN